MKDLVLYAGVLLSEKQPLAIGQPVQSFQPTGRLLDNPRLATIRSDERQSEITWTRGKRARVGQLLSVGRERRQYFINALVVVLDWGALQCFEGKKLEPLVATRKRGIREGDRFAVG
jgi:hypothetical protein